MIVNISKIYFIFPEPHMELNQAKPKVIPIKNQVKPSFLTPCLASMIVTPAAEKTKNQLKEIF